MMKNAFYLIFKALFVLKIFKFLLNGLIREIRLISRFMTSHPGLQRMKTNILPNISRIKANQTMEFGQLINIPKEIIFFKNYAQHEAGKLVPNNFLFLKKALY